MSFKGTVKNGVVMLPPKAKLPNGTKVTVTTVADAAKADFTDMLVGISKKVRGLPSDLAKQHDHYLYGTRKK